MKTIVIISGQISGNSKLRNAIHNHDSEESRIQNTIVLKFPTKKAAYKALWEAYKALRSDKQDAQASMLSYAKGFISYDASTAIIQK